MRRAVLAVLALVAAGGVAVAVGADAALQTGPVRTRLGAAVERATGHRTNLVHGAVLSVSGVWTLRPTVEARNLAVFNPPGFSRPALATVDRLTARLALLPLLAGRVDVEAVTLDGADVRLERDAAGHGNWERAADPAAPANAPAAPAARRDTRIGHVTVTDTTFAWPGAPAIAITRLDAEPSGGPVSGTVALNGVPFTVSGTAGPEAMDLSGSGAGATLALRRANGTIDAHAEAADLSTLSPLLGRPLPPLRNLVVDARLPSEGALALRATAGPSPFGPDLVLNRFELALPSPDMPIESHATGHLRDLSFVVSVTLPPASTLRAPMGRLPLRGAVQADEGTVSLDGSVADLSGGDLQATLSGRVPDLRRTGALAGVALPALHDLAIDARLARVPAGGVAVRGLRATAAEGDLGGDLALRLAPRPSLRGSLVSQRLDLDAASPPVPAPPPGPAAAASPPEPGPQAPVARPLPFALLRGADLDLRAAAAAVQWHGVSFRAAQVRVLLQDGRLRLDPAEAFTPGGGVQAQLAADATATPPTAALALLAPGLDAAALAAALGQPGAVTGTADLDIELRGAGADLPAMLPTLDGHAGLALVNGDIDNGLLLTVFGPALRAAKLTVESSGRTPLRCLAVRADATAGQVQLRTLALDSARLRLEGDGSVDLPGASLDLHLRPTVRLGGAGVAVPVHLSGPFRAPTPTLERGAISPGRVGLSILLGGSAAAPDPCGPALAAARGNRPGPAPPGPAPQ